MTNRGITHVIVFDCGHTRIFPDPPPVKADEVFCHKCDMYTTVKLAPDEYRIRCENCQYSRPFGTAKLNAEIAAVKHRKANPTHVVTLRNGNQFVRTFDGRGGDGRNQTVTSPLF